MPGLESGAREPGRKPHADVRVLRPDRELVFPGHDARQPAGLEAAAEQPLDGHALGEGKVRRDHLLREEHAHAMQRLRCRWPDRHRRGRGMPDGRIRCGPRDGLARRALGGLAIREQGLGLGAGQPRALVFQQGRHRELEHLGQRSAVHLALVAGELEVPEQEALARRRREIQPATFRVGKI